MSHGQETAKDPAFPVIQYCLSWAHQAKGAHSTRKSVFFLQGASSCSDESENWNYSSFLE